MPSKQAAHYPHRQMYQTYISEFDQSHFSQFADAVVRGSGLQEQLRQAHLLTPKAHFIRVWPLMSVWTCTPRSCLSLQHKHHQSQCIRRKVQFISVKLKAGMALIRAYLFLATHRLSIIRIISKTWCECDIYMSLYIYRVSYLAGWRTIIDLYL